MSKKPANLVHETSTTTGTGNFTLTNANGKQSFNTAFGNGATTNVFDYFISNQSAAEWERGTGHLSAASTLVRDTVLESTNGGAAVNFSAGTKDVTNDIPANDNYFCADGTGIYDDNSNEQVIFSKTASAVNYLSIANAATNTNPYLQAQGDDTNIGLTFKVKGAVDFNAPDSAVKFDLGTSYFPFIDMTVSNNSDGGPVLRWFALSASPAALDNIAAFSFYGKNSSATTTQYGGISGFIQSPSAGSEGFYYDFNAYVSGVFHSTASFGNGVIIGDQYTSGTAFPGLGSVAIASDAYVVAGNLIGGGGPAVTTHAALGGL